MSPPCHATRHKRLRLEDQGRDVPDNTADVLPCPSAEQREVIRAILSGHCVTVPSVAGSGKTTCMLQVARSLPLHRRVLIVTYNRSLCDESKKRIAACNLESVVRCYTIHGLVSRVSGTVCNDDGKLEKVVSRWDSGDFDYSAINRSSVALDLVMLDEAQDLRPPFYRAICHMLKLLPVHRGNGIDGTIQMCIVGDPKQLLYDFPTYGNDKASPQYIMDPQTHWGQHTGNRIWVERRLSVSYRLTPNIATFVNAVWGTSIQGGNTRDDNLPVEYLCKYPFPSKRRPCPENLDTSFLAQLIDEHGAENVLLLAQSVRNEKCPIRVHVNELMKHRTRAGEQKYHFHIKENARGFEGSTDVKNKIRVWTFCGSKGCEADVVVFFGLDCSNATRVYSLNQVGVALSRARKRLIVIHGKTYQEKKLVASAYYPLLGESKEGMPHSIFHNGVCLSSPIVPPYTEGDTDALQKRSLLSQLIFELLAQNGILTPPDNALPTDTFTAKSDDSEMVYNASEFGYFSASEERRFLSSYGTWSTERGVKERLNYTVDVQFEKTKEDVSALYGEALTYMLQWDRDGFCPNIETVVNDGILRFSPSRLYKEGEVRAYIFRVKQCEPLPKHCDQVFEKEFKSRSNNEIKGKDLIRLLNTRITVKKKREDGERVILFRVKALEEQTGEDDEIMKQFVSQIRSIYDAPSKTAPQWIYLANAVMAFGQYHEKWNQIGTDPDSYERWVDSTALLQGLSRLQALMACLPLNSRYCDSRSPFDSEDNLFEREMIYEFAPDRHINSPTKQGKIVGVQGICDWIGVGLVTPEKRKSVDLLEIKFTHELSNIHRLQLLVYCALLSVERNRSTSGMIFNARTCETEACSIEVNKARELLHDISQFKYDGTYRKGEVTAAGEDAPASGAEENPICLE